jgi:hypothetical protein
MAQKLARKITIKEVVGDKMKILAAALTGRDGEAATGKEVPIMTVMGRVDSFRTGEGDNGPFIKLMGDFEAVNLLTGEITSNSMAILPNHVGGGIVAAIKGGAQGIQFAVEIRVKFDITSATSYMFEIYTHMKPQASDAIAAIKAQLVADKSELPGIALAPSVPALSAPEATPAPAPKKK